MCSSTTLAWLLASNCPCSAYNVFTTELIHLTQFTVPCTHSKQVLVLARRPLDSKTCMDDAPGLTPTLTLQKLLFRIRNLNTKHTIYSEEAVRLSKLGVKADIRRLLSAPNTIGSDLVVAGPLQLRHLSFQVCNTGLQLGRAHEGVALVTASKFDL